jgi:hypothetical protein
VIDFGLSFFSISSTRFPFHPLKDTPPLAVSGQDGPRS